jgi:hypothetical protein
MARMTGNQRLESLAHDACINHLRHVAYAPPDGGIADFCLINDGYNWHLYHIYREFGRPMDCHAPGQETKIGHAVSKDLATLTPASPAICARVGEWDSAHLWAPSAVQSGGKYWMFYTGMSDDLCQKIGVAVSDDLFEWEYPLQQPVVDVTRYAWAASDPRGYTSCRDPYVVRLDGVWGCYYTARSMKGDPVVGIAVSLDLLDWEDRGYVLSRPLHGSESGGTSGTESPCVFRRGDLYYLVYNQGRGIRYTFSDNPFDFGSEPIRRLMDGIYNFEMLDLAKGLFAYADIGYYSCLRFGMVEFDGAEMTMSL